MKNSLQKLTSVTSTLISVLIVGLFITQLSTKLKDEVGFGKTSEVVKVDPKLDPQSHARQAKELEINARFKQAVIMLNHKKYDYAIKALHRVIELSPRMPEAHVNLGYAFLGGGDAKSARDFFMSAIELKQDQLNAYYGLAMAAEKLGDMEMALGAMRTYVHLSPKDDPFLAKARSALWEWQEARNAKTRMYQNQSEKK